MHILTRNNQLVYKDGISAIDAFVKIEQYVENADRNAKIFPTDLSKEPDAINRTQLWTILYKKGLPGEKIKHIRRGHQRTRLSPKYKGGYGEPMGNNIGESQG